ncbi:unnamed protein product [Gemmataceae bacterium]|nr:unnamed protein product [Gemmataceae bacterium]VIP10874.1 unnamed protein product [Gemmataceae bacterium]VTT98980.1 unnamed protein product [Gemmataceae bacterium]VTU00893.1 unnamed protein product [Gemmataceae bacterium]
MTITDLEIHYDRLGDVRAEILGQGDEPPAELIERMQRVRALIAAVRHRHRTERVPASRPPAGAATGVELGALRA